MTPGGFDSTALPDGPPHLIDRLDAAIDEGEKWVTDFGGWYVDTDCLRELVAVAREARAVLDAEGFGR